LIAQTDPEWKCQINGIPGCGKKIVVGSHAWLKPPNMRFQALLSGIRQLIEEGELRLKGEIGK